MIPYLALMKFQSCKNIKDGYLYLIRKLNGGLCALDAFGHRHRSFMCPCLMGLFLLLFGLYPRLVQLGDYIGMDEGSYSFICALFAEDYGNKSLYGLSLYPFLLSWAYLAPGNPAFYLRICDMFAMLAMLFVFTRILQRESGNCFLGLFLAIIFLAPMSSPAVMDAGFKNSIPVALFCLFLAWLTAEKCKNGMDWHWFVAGALTAAGLLLRESFILFAILGLCSVFMGWGFSACLRYVAGALLTTLIVLAFYHFAWLDSGGIWPFIDGYIGRGKFYTHETWRIFSSFVIRQKNYLNLFGFQCILFFAALAAPSGRKRLPRAFWFWLATSVAALVEPLTKPGFAYHIAVCMPGIAVCTAILWRLAKPLQLHALPWGNRGLYGFFIFCLFINIVHAFLLLPGYRELNRGFLALAAHNDEAAHERYMAGSQGLAVVEAMRRHKAGAKSLAVSGFSFFLYPSAGLMPPKDGFFDSEDKYHLADLSRSYISLDRNSSRLLAEIRKNPPELIAVGVGREDHESDWHRELIQIIEKSRMYELVEFVPWSSRSYGFMAYLLYRLKPEFAKPSGEGDKTRHARNCKNECGIFDS